MSKTLRIHVVMQRLDCSKSHVYKLIETGQLAAVDISATTADRASWRVPEDALDRFIASRRSSTM